MAYKLNDVAISLNGATPVLDASVTIPTVTTASIGNSTGLWTGGINYWVGHIRRIAYYNRRLSNTQIQQLSGPSGSNSAGIAYTVIGQMITTTIANANDVWSGGWRLDNLGAVVVAAQSGSPVYNGGLPFNPANGAMASQLDTTPAANDPYVGEIRVGPTGGVYFTSASPPSNLRGYSAGFSAGFK
jgi:hypothetical protein